MPLQFTPIQNDISEANAKLEALYKAYNDLETKVNAGGGTVDNTKVPLTRKVSINGNTQTLANDVSFNVVGAGGSPYSNIITLPQDTYINEIRPLDYGVTYNNGKVIGSYYGSGYEHAPGINYGSNAPDNIYQTASYNLTPKGNRNTNDGGWYFGRIERHYDISPQYLDCFEPHVWGFKDYNDVSHRSLSGYFSKLTGTGFWHLQANIFKIDSYNPATKTVAQLFSVNDGLLNLYATNNQIGMNFHNPLGEYVAYQRFTGGYTQIKMNRAFFATNAAALASGLKAGEEYATRVNGILVTAIVE